MEGDNVYTELEGYTVYDASRREIGKLEHTVYDAPSDVLKYVVVDGHAVPAERIEVSVDEESVFLPYDAGLVESAPELRETSGAFDEKLHRHYGEDV
jgi:sporulation protein YlmC with PRC-barrel domain